MQFLPPSHIALLRPSITTRKSGGYASAALQCGGLFCDWSFRDLEAEAVEEAHRCREHGDASLHRDVSLFTGAGLRSQLGRAAMADRADARRPATVVELVETTPRKYPPQATAAGLGSHVVSIVG